MSVPFVLTNVSFFFGALEFANRINRLDLGAQVEPVDLTNFKSGGWKEAAGALRSAEWSFDGFWESSPDEADAIFSAALGAGGTPVLATPGDADPGALGYGIVALQTSHKVGLQIGAAASLSVQLRSQRPMARGRVVAGGTATASEFSTGLQLGAVGADQRLFYAGYVPAVDGDTPSLDLVVESDAANDFASPVTRATLPQFVTPGSSWGLVSGPITDDWFRVALTVGGTAPSVRYVVFLAIV